MLTTIPHTNFVMVKTKDNITKNLPHRNGGGYIY